MAPLACGARSYCLPQCGEAGAGGGVEDRVGVDAVGAVEVGDVAGLAKTVDPQRDAGESVYFRLSTRPIDQPQRTIDSVLAEAIIAGAYWLAEPGPNAELAIAFCGAVAPEALAAHQEVAEDIPDAGLLAITSPDRLHRDWRVARARGETGVAEHLLARLRPGAALVTVGDFHPATLSWLGAVAGNAIVPLGVDRFGQSGDIPDLYRAYGFDTDAILDAAARACLTALPRTARRSG